MSKLFQIALPLQAYVYQPGDLTATLSYDGDYQIIVKLPQGAMGFKGKTEAEIKKDILKALRAMAQQDVVPDLALEVVAEILSDLPYSIVQINDKMESATKASPEETLRTFWGSLFGDIQEVTAPEPVQQVEDDTSSEYIETPFGRVRLISLSGEDLPESLQAFLGNLLDSQEDEEQPQPTTKRYS